QPNEPERERRFPVLLRSAWFGLNKTFRRRLKEHGLTPAQFISLRWLVESPRGTLSQMDLSRLTASNANNVADLVARMEDEGLLSRAAGKEDARVKMLFLTDLGRCAYERARVTAVTLQTEILSGLDHAERETFLELLERVGESLENLAAESSCLPPASP
ncbi:MAG: MarR family transcriptional regulator, partial [Opitutales bacterium]